MTSSSSTSTISSSSSSEASPTDGDEDDEAAAPPPVMGQGAKETQLFEWLCENFGVFKSVTLGEGAARGLVATQAHEEGDVLLQVPGGVCIWTRRDGVVGGLAGQTDLCWEAAGDLRKPVTDDQFVKGVTWDVRLALALLEATSDVQVGGRLWDMYGRLLPRPHQVTLPLCLSDSLLEELQDDLMAVRAMKQKARLRSLFPLLMQSHRSHPTTTHYANLDDQAREYRAQALAEVEEAAAAAAAAGEGGGEAGEAGGGSAAAVAAASSSPPPLSETVPMALQWAFAMVRSRCFTASDDDFAMVPFMDMANHHPTQPNANFTYDAQSDSFLLYALSPVKEGDEVTISYGVKYTNQQLMTQYGFSIPTNPHFLLQLEQQHQQKEASFSPSPEFRRGLMDILFMRAQDHLREASELSEASIRRAMPMIPVLADAVLARSEQGDATVGATKLLQGLRSYSAAQFEEGGEGEGGGESSSTALEADRELLRAYEEGREEAAGQDVRFWACLKYRVERRMDAALAIGALVQYLKQQPDLEEG